MFDEDEVQKLRDQLSDALARAVAAERQVDEGVRRMLVLSRERDAARHNIEQARRDLSAETAARQQLKVERDALRGALQAERQVSRLALADLRRLEAEKSGGVGTCLPQEDR